MSNYIKIKKGLDIPLDGFPKENTSTNTDTQLFGIVPEDFTGVVWKARVKPGDNVKIGSTLLSDKASDSIALVSPVAGTVEQIIRGERRKIIAVTVKENPDQSDDSVNFSANLNDVRRTLQRSGLWAMMRQRPFDIVPNPDSNPRDIFVTLFDSSPLAPSYLSESDLPALTEGLKILKSLTSGSVYIGTSPNLKINTTGLERIKGVVVNEFDGPHPAGNVGVQIAAIKPVNKGEVVWTLDGATAVRIGRLFTTGKCNWETKVAVTGPEAINPHMVVTKAGASLSTLLKGFLPNDISDLRVISGNVLTGIAENPTSGFLRYPYRQITIIREGKNADEFMGWASISPSKFSVKRSFPAFLRGLSKPFPFDARIKGGHRAMILSEEYDKVFPFDIYPEYLIKAIMNGDLDRMEKLGIYEVAPEDFALPEFVDTSKIELQRIVRDGLDKLRAEL